MDRAPGDLFVEQQQHGPASHGLGSRMPRLLFGVVPIQLRYLTFLPLVILFLVTMHVQDSRSHSAQLSRSVIKQTLKNANARDVNVEALRGGFLPSAVGKRAAATSAAAGGAATYVVDDHSDAGASGVNASGDEAFIDASMGRTLRVMTYNVWNFDDGAGWEEERLPEIAEVIRRAHPALVGLQELRVRGEQHQGHQLQAALQALGLQYHLKYVKAMQYNDAEEGIGVLSRFPINKIRVRKLPMGGGDDDNTRMCMMVEVTVPRFGDVQLFNTHLSFNTNQQVWNAAEVLRFADEFQFAGSQFLVGDMNTPPREVAPIALFQHNQTWLSQHSRADWPRIEWPEFKGAPFVDAWVQQHPADIDSLCDESSCTFSTFELKTRCDYVLYRGSVTGMKTTVVGRMQNEGDAAKQIAPSDHMAVVATVHLGAETS